ncbi:alpha-2-macroglobulin family protein [Verrucomicrobium spinosum]|nr:alpha-2-macroglobulin family protein [Verrucomicrobium spinosum]
MAGSIDGLLAANQTAGGADEAVPMIRQDFADLLVWHAAATTDAQGKVSLPVHFPDDLTTWKLRAWVLGPNTEVGEASVEVISRKDLLVRMQAPRFFVEKDEVVLSGIVHNDLKEKQNVRAVLELDGRTLAPLEGQATEQRFEIAPGGEHRFDWRVKVIAEGEATVRMKALAAGESDAVEKKFPVYVHGMLRQDAWSLAIRPDQGQGTITFEVPEMRRPAQTRFEVRYSPSLAAAMVDALPFLVSYPHGCTEQTLNRFVPTVITQKVLLDLGLDLKAIRDKGVNLNAQELGDPVKRAQQWRRYRKNDQDPVFDEKVVKKMAAAGVERLESMQANDGGWGWWPGAAQGTAHLTAQVVEGLLQARAAGAEVPAGMLSRGLDWLSRHEEKELRRLNLPEKTQDHKFQADNEDALVHAALVAGERGNKGMRTHLYNDRLKLSKSMQALVGLACATVKETERRDMIIRNLEQFQKQDEENQTAWLDFGNDQRWWYWYDDETETLAAYLKLRLIKDGKDPVASRLVKYLLNNRKHGNYWKSTRDTAAAISALAKYIKSSGETAPDLLVELWLDGKKVKEAPINKDNLFSFDHAFVIEGEALTAGKHQLEIRRKGAGPLYANAYLACFTLEDHLRAAGLEVKVQRNLYKLVPEKTQDLVSGAHGQALKQQGSRYRREPLGPEATVKSGDLLEVELITESKNDYEYLMLEDFKPAGCEAVDLQSGYFWSQGLNTYREFRDEKVTHYLERLPRGKQSLTYRLRAEIPGKFSALPSVIEGMYAPELKGNAEERSVVVEE